jgi:nitrate reductase gamma subunit
MGGKTHEASISRAGQRLKSVGPAFTAAVALILIPWLGVGGLGLRYVFGVVIPYAGLMVFIIAFVYRLVKWSWAPVPFKIPTTAGQQKSLAWIKQSKLDNPFTRGQVIGRMILEVFLFRSLFRNSAMKMRQGPKLSYASAKWLWIFAIAFHYAFLITVFRHLRFFIDPVPVPVRLVERLDGWLQIGLPQIMVSGLLLLTVGMLLLARRLLIPKLRYISLANDYFPLFLIIAIASTGALMRYVTGIDTTSVKELAMGLVTFRPVAPEKLQYHFFIHIFLVSTLLAYLPFSKLMHMGGIFFSPTRNLANNSRAVRHVNPWNAPAEYHTYEAYEEEFREKMIKAGIPVEKQPSASTKEE